MGIDRRAKAVLSFQERARAILESYEGMVADAEHWNRVNPEKEPIVIEPIDLDGILETMREPDTT